MVVETAMRDRLERTVGSTAIGELVGFGEIAAAANRRNRRARVVGGLGTILVVAMVLIGVGTALRDPDPSAVFAGNDAVSLVPSSTASLDGELVGVALADTDFDSFAAAREFVFVRSDGGESWEVIEHLPTVEASSAAIAVHDGTVHLVTAQEVPDQGGFLLVHQQSSDLEELTTVSETQPDGFDNAARLPEILRAVARDTGVAVEVRSFPGWTTENLTKLEELGVKPEGICELAVGAATVRYRVCGEVTWDTFEVEAAGSVDVVQNFVMFAPVGQDFAVVTPPTDTDNVASSFPTGAMSLLYPTSDGFGLAAIPPVETVDFQTWNPVNTGGDVSPTMAVRGGERVFRSFGHVQRFGPDDPAVGMAYSADNGTTWDDIDIEVLYDSDTDGPRWFPDLQAGPGGWAMVAQRPPSDDPILGVERSSPARDAEFVLTAGDYELAGRTPFGPATLTDGDGQIVRSWDQLEVMRPGFSGFLATEQTVSLDDEVSGETLVTFSNAQWTAIAEPEAQPYGEFDLVVSSNGVEWSVVHVSGNPQQILAITDDAVVIRTMERFPFADVISRSSVMVVEFPTEAGE